MHAFELYRGQPIDSILCEADAGLVRISVRSMIVAPNDIEWLEKISASHITVLVPGGSVTFPVKGLLSEIGRS